MPRERRYALTAIEGPTDVPGLIQDAISGISYQVDSSGTRTPLGGGGGSTQRGYYRAPNLVIPPDTWYNPAWVFGNIGEDFLDLSDTANPAVVEAGVYSVGVEFQLPDAADYETGKACYLELDLDLNGEDANLSISQSLDPSLDAGNNLNTGLTLSWFIPVGGVISAALQHNSSADIGNGYFQLWVQRLS